VENFWKTQVLYKDYIIEIVNESGYTLNSADNVISYRIEYFDEIASIYHTSKHGIRVAQGGIELASAIICETGGTTTVHAHSAVVVADSILICCCDKVYSLSIPELTLNWKRRIDPATCFAIYFFNGDFLIHGELQITRIDKEGNEKWIFAARDIFVAPDGQEAFALTESKIKLKDWQGYEYILNEHGEDISDFDKPL
jgi:hypothetical protein